MTSSTFISEDQALMDDWDYSANTTLDPSKLSKGSNKRANWVCHVCKHKWVTRIYHRATRGTGCPSCHHSKRKNYNSHSSLKYTHPEIVDNWHPFQNDLFKPEMFTKGSRFKAYWLCKSCGNEWHQKINGYTGCPKCKKVKRLIESNLADNHPELIKEWDFLKNNDLDPKSISQSSIVSVHWKCQRCDYKWQSRISNRAKLGRGCPACAGKVVVKGKNDLETTAPYLARQWNFNKNIGLTPSDVSIGQRRKVWWTCAEGHDYEASILHRGHGTDCPIYFSGRQTSFAEQAVYFYVKQLYPDAINRFKADFLGKMELDIYIPSIKLAIEYDGEAWHKNNTLNREKRKYERCSSQGIKLIRLREKLPPIGSDIADYLIHTEKLYEHKNLEKVICELLKRINFSSSWLMTANINVDVEKDKQKIFEYRTALKNGSLLEKFPSLCKEWDANRNGDLKPFQFKPGSDVKVWWKCPNCNNNYLASIGHRTRGTNCPKCAVKKVTDAKTKGVHMIEPSTNHVVASFESISDAGRQMKISNSNITMVCKGTRKTAGGYIWKYS